MNSDQKNPSEQDVERILENVGPLELPTEDMAARVKANVKQVWLEETVNENPSLGVSRQWFGIAAVVALVTFVVLLSNLMESGTAPRQVVALIDHTGANVETSIDGAIWEANTSQELMDGVYLRALAPVSMTLENKMNARLASGSTMILHAGNHIELLNGSIYADSHESESTDSLLIQTAFGSARDIGTQFQVTATEDQWSVQVREGEVLIKDSSYEDRLQSGEKVSIGNDDQLTESQLDSRDASWRWTESVRPEFNIEGRHLNEYLEWAARETGRELRYVNDGAKQSAKSAVLSGTIAGLSAADSLDLVMHTTDLRLIETSETVIMVGLFNP